VPRGRAKHRPQVSRASFLGPTLLLTEDGKGPRFCQELEADIVEDISEGLVQGTTEKCWLRQAHTGTDAPRSSGCVDSL